MYVDSQPVLALSVACSGHPPTDIHILHVKRCPPRADGICRLDGSQAATSRSTMSHALAQKIVRSRLSFEAHSETGSQSSAEQYESALLQYTESLCISHGFYADELGGPQCFPIAAEVIAIKIQYSSLSCLILLHYAPSSRIVHQACLSWLPTREIETFHRHPRVSSEYRLHLLRPRAAFCPEAFHHGHLTTLSRLCPSYLSAAHWLRCLTGLRAAKLMTYCQSPAAATAGSRKWLHASKFVALLWILGLV